MNLVTEQVWVLDHHQLFGDTSQPDPWNALDELTKERLPRADGHLFPSVANFVDVAGHRRDIATRFCNKRKGRGFYAIVGKAEKGGQRSEIWTPVASFKNKLRTPIWPISVNAAKDLLSARLNIKDGSRNGYITFSDRLGDEWFEQLAAERAVPTLIDGRWVRLWKPRTKGNVRNEAWDLCVYAMALLRHVQSLPPTDLKRLLPPPPKMVADLAIPIPGGTTTPVASKLAPVPVPKSVGDETAPQKPQTKQTQGQPQGQSRLVQKKSGARMQFPRNRTRR
jgi:phage terminase large subunit GpA-like protein